MQAAQATRPELVPLATYARARAAETLGAEDRAVQDYRAALSADPDNAMLASRALGQATVAGDLPLALRAARTIEAAGTLPPDARLVLLADAVRSKNWSRARSLVDGLDDEDVFAFLKPVARAWIAQGSGKGDPFDALATGTTDPLALPFVSRARPLLLIAGGRQRQGLELLQKLNEGGDSREWRLRMSAAASLVRKHDRERAAAILAGDEEALAAARALVAAGKPLRAEIATAPAGIAEMLLGLALDLREQGVDSLALSFARIAGFFAPDDAEIRLVTGALLAAREQGSALEVLRSVPSDSPFAEAALDAQVGLLAREGEHEAALHEAEAAVHIGRASVADWTRLGALYDELGRHDDAAEAYAKALDAARAGRAEQPEWLLLLLRGGALEQADRWAEAKAALEAAYKLAPDQAVVLNYLGYAQIERRENIDAAAALIREASRMAPDSPQITDSLGWARYLMGDVHEAVELLERAVQGDPEDAAISEHLGDAYYSAGRHFEARYAWRAALVAAEDEAADRLRAKIEKGLTAELASP